jgi:putative sterol carrier protein
VSQALAAAFAAMQQRYKPGVVQERLVLYFSLGEAEGQKWTVELGPETCQVRPGKTENADVLLKTSEELFLKLLRGEWSPGVMDFMTGRIKTNDPARLGVLKQCFG